MAAPNRSVALRVFPCQSLPVIVLIIALGNAWSLQYAGAQPVGDGGLPPFGSLFTVHVLIAAAFIATLSLRCELFVPTTGELGFFCLAGLLGITLALAVELAVAARIPAGLITFALTLIPIFVIAIARAVRTERIGRREASTVLLAARWTGRLNTLQVATGIAIAATTMLVPFAALEGSDMFLVDGRFGTADLALGSLALIVGGEYYLLTLIMNLSGTTFAEFVFHRRVQKAEDSIKARL